MSNSKETKKKERFAKLKSANEKLKQKADSNIKIEDIQDIRMPEKIANFVKHIALLILFVLIFVVVTGFVVDTTMDIIDGAIKKQNEAMVKDPILFVTFAASFATSINTAILILGLPKLYKFCSKKLGNVIHKVSNKDKIQERKEKRIEKLKEQQNS